MRAVRIRSHQRYCFIIMIIIAHILTHKTCIYNTHIRSLLTDNENVLTHTSTAAILNYLLRVNIANSWFTRGVIIITRSAR